jgi:long-subunit fatty acid transport protein
MFSGMKKIIAIVFFGFISINSMAQSNFSFGINAGATYSSFRGNPQIEAFNAGVDFLVGISLEYKLKERLSLIANINYDRKTASQSLYTEIIENPDDPGFYGDMKIKFKNQFISMPVMAKYKFGTDNSFYLNGGLLISYMLKSQLWNDYDDVNTDFTDNYKKLDFGLVFGLGKSFELKNNNKISVELRENLGLNNISNVAIADNGSIRTNSLNLICNYSFDF